MSTKERGHPVREKFAGLETPDITKAQLVAIAESVLAVAVAFGFDLSNAERTSLLALAAVIGAFLTGADAYIRNGRAQAAAGVEELRQALADVRVAFEAPPDSPPPNAPPPSAAETRRGGL